MLLWKRDFQWERDVPPWLIAHYPWFVVPSFAYPVMVHYMRGVCRFDLRIPLFVWNALLAVYSGVSFAAVAPHHFRRLFVHGYEESVCMWHKEESFLMQPYGWWMFLFVLSKVVEYGDTVFLILRGREVQFLHWYHHLATLFASYLQAMRGSTLFEWTAVTNLAIHTWMYGHYAASAVCNGVRGNRWLTNFQILQMLHGFFLAFYHAKRCKKEVDVSAMTLFFIYAFMFIEFYLRKYRRGGKRE